MQQFDLSLWLQDKSRKVVTRQGKPVRIICTDRKHSESWPIVALESYDSGEFVLYANDKGRTDLANENIHDLFFADEEEGFTEFEKELKAMIEDVQNGYYTEEESFDFWKKRLLDLARKQLQSKDYDRLYDLFKSKIEILNLHPYWNLNC